MEASSASSGLGQHLAEHDLWNLSLSGYLRLCRECKLADNACPASTLELLFAQVDAKDEDSSGEGRYNKSRMLTPHEFVQCLVRIAIEKYVKTRVVTDVSDAVERLCRANLAANLPRGAAQNSNVFRSKCCYVERVDRCLRRHRATLKALYDRYSDLESVSAHMVPHLVQDISSSCKPFHQPQLPKKILSFDNLPR